VINIAATLNIDLTDDQAQQIADAVANSQKAQDSLTDFKNQLEIAHNRHPNPRENPTNNKLLTELCRLCNEFYLI
jgi:uncharacterized protein YpuA (DUF1002 family)